ncbi:hypothetical protein [Acidovorax sp. SUPP2825]|uniref:hypothetical protein n=1 Tax=Acidovorax sp. SUPP2825 TaxID=2920879 RepID=UPI0023DE4733|nr:hypothetical protein [Acidovorax sp. SUPP2825]GKS93206.1 hypothetical protein AVAK2825_01745 [Acidovorax sp. SUPP2825]
MKQPLEDRVTHLRLVTAVLAPDFDLLAKPPQVELPPAVVAPPQVLQRLVELRDEYVRGSSRGKFRDAASLEWRGLPIRWRMVLVMVAGIGLEVDELSTLASRDWQEMPPPEQDALRTEIRLAKKHFTRITALAARV